MSNFKKTLRDNVIAPYNKYSLSQEKVGEVIESYPERNMCTVMYKNIDGILVTRTNVVCKKSSLKGILKGFPKVGEWVELQEVGKIIRITGIAEKNMLAEAKQENTDIYSGASDFSGFLGI